VAAVLHLNVKDPKDVADDRRYYFQSSKARAENGEALIRIAVDWVAARLRSMMESS
jgi:creatinine amidohydrolase/Fe(II)-dependent formamide hydrolase-like protein